MRNILEVAFVVALLVVASLSGGALAFNQALLSSTGTPAGPPAAIARVNTAVPTLVTNANPQFTFSYQTTANTNEMLVVGVWVSPQTTADSQISATYNGHACSDSGAAAVNQNEIDSIILEFCPLGTTDSLLHNLVVTIAFTTSFVPHVRVTEYSGVAQTSYLDGGQGANGTSPLTTTFSTVSAGDWLVGLSQTRNGPISIGPSGSAPVSLVGADFGGSDGNVIYADSNGTAAPGSHTATWTQSLQMVALMLGLVPSNSSTGGIFPPCTTNFAYDWSMFAGCNAISMVIR